MMRLVTSVLFVCTLLAANAINAQNLGGSPEGKAMKNPVPATEKSIAAGGQTYQKMCAFCHGKEGLGDGKMAPKGTTPANLVDDKWDRGETDGEIFLVLRDGAGPKFQMKGLKGKYSDTELWNVVNYVRSLSARGKGN